MNALPFTWWGGRSRVLQFGDSLHAGEWLGPAGGQDFETADTTALADGWGIDASPRDLRLPPYGDAISATEEVARPYRLLRISEMVSLVDGIAVDASDRDRRLPPWRDTISASESMSKRRTKVRLSLSESAALSDRVTKTETSRVNTARWTDALTASESITMVQPPPAPNNVPQNVQLERSSYNPDQARASWDAVTGASSYRVYDQYGKPLYTTFTNYADFGFYPANSFVCVQVSAVVGFTEGPTSPVLCSTI